MNNDTPRTNAQEFDSKLCHPDTAVDAEFARELERENARLVQVVNEAKEWLQHERGLGGMRCFASNALQVLLSALPNVKMSQTAKNQ